MDIKRCFEILELNSAASITEVKQSYKDLVNIWHPDRFSNNPRLKQRAEKKLKEINRAYETAVTFFSSKSGRGKQTEKGAYAGAQGETGFEAGTKASDYQAETETKLEAVVEATTIGVLNLWSYLSTKFRYFASEQIQAFKEGAQVDDTQRANKGHGQGMSKGKARDKSGK